MRVWALGCVCRGACVWVAVRVSSGFWDTHLLLLSPARFEKKSNHSPGPPPHLGNLEGRGCDGGGKV